MKERWQPKSAKAIEREANPRQSKLPVKPVGKNHFIPRWYIRDNWAVDLVRNAFEEFVSHEDFRLHGNIEDIAFAKLLADMAELID